MSQPHYQWHTMRKLWHISACLFMIAFYFLWQGILAPVHWLNFLLFFVWLLTIIFLSIDIIRFYQPLENKAFLRLPFYAALLRRHEHTGYNSSTHSLVASAIMITVLYFGWLTEFSLVCAIAVMALCDPAAALGRYLFQSFRADITRIIGFVFFVLSALVILFGVGWFYGLSKPLAFIAAALVAALAEAYAGQLWNWFKRMAIIIASPLNLRAPLWLSGFYPDDNLTAPLALAFALLFFGL